MNSKKLKVGKNLKLYAITDRNFHPKMSLLDQVEQAIKGGATLIQLRDKDILADDLKDLSALSVLNESKFIEYDAAEFIGDNAAEIIEDDAAEIYERERKEARQLLELCHKYDVPLIINDNVRLALDIDADGVHLGQDDMNPIKARGLLGEGKIIGVTAKTTEQALKAQQDGADYLGSGAVFGSNTKKDAKPMTKETLKAITEAVDIPVVAIGGINADNVTELEGTGICGVAVVGGIFDCNDIEAAARHLKEKVEEIL